MNAGPAIRQTAVAVMASVAMVAFFLPTVVVAQLVEPGESRQVPSESAPRADGYGIEAVLVSQAERAAEDAKRAKAEASAAQAVASSLAAQLRASTEQNRELAEQANEARARADEAIRAAEQAQLQAEQTRVELENRANGIVQETQAMIENLQLDSSEVEARLNRALDAQRAAAEDRESLLIYLFIGGAIALLIIVFGMQRLTNRTGSGRSNPVRKTAPAEPSRLRSNATALHEPQLTEYVLDGRDEDGIRYLLRISGNQLNEGDDGVVIGRNPSEAPCTINHADVSRKHARLKLMKNRVFIEDLGSTNGTSVNGQSIDEKGPVSVNAGDQIIIGSVVMKFRVLNA